MSSHACEGYSPMRAKRRQSDAKWRASVATCYNALKFVVPNVKHLSKRKISKALILQESEKHIKDLEEAIGYMLDVECEDKGQAVLWKAGFGWTHCSLDKLRQDFSEKQRKVFHTSSHGRRCYNLLQDIKDEVFNMKADPRNLVFIRATSNGLQWKEEYKEECCPSNMSVLNMGQVVKEWDRVEESSHHISGNESEEAVLRNIASQSSLVTKAQPTHRLMINKKKEGDTLLLSGHLSSKGWKSCPELLKKEIASCTVSRNPCQTLPVMTSSLSSLSPVSTIQSSSVFGVNDAMATSGKTYMISDTINKWKAEQQCVKPADLERNRSISHLDYPTLWRELENERDQEVPSLKTPLKMVKLHHLIQDNSKTVSEGLTAIKGTLDGLSKQNTTSDPFLGSATPAKVNTLFSCSENDWINKYPAKFSCARKKLNFGPHVQCDSCIVSPDVRSEMSSAISGFTPVKLPADFKLKCETNSPVNDLTSPWKALNSPYDTRIVPQGYLGHHASLEFEDNLLCFETMETIDMDSNIPDVGTPTQTKAQNKKEKAEDGFKRKRTSSQGSEDRTQPKCRKSLERFYDLPSEASLPDDCHVVPQMETPGMWNNQPESTLTLDNPIHTHTVGKQPNTLGETLAALTHWPDFQGFFFYYRHVAVKLKDRLGSHDMQSPVVVAKVAQMWSRLTHQEKNTMSTLADLEDQSETSRATCGSLSHDLEEVEVEPLDLHQFLPATFL